MDELLIQGSIPSITVGRLCDDGAQGSIPGVHVQGSIPFVGWMMGHRVRFLGCSTGFNSLSWSVDGAQGSIPSVSGPGVG